MTGNNGGNNRNNTLFGAANPNIEERAEYHPERKTDMWDVMYTLKRRGIKYTRSNTISAPHLRIIRCWSSNSHNFCEYIFEQDDTLKQYSFYQDGAREYIIKVLNRATNKYKVDNGKPACI